MVTSESEIPVHKVQHHKHGGCYHESCDTDLPCQLFKLDLEGGLCVCLLRSLAGGLTYLCLVAHFYHNTFTHTLLDSGAAEKLVRCKSRPFVWLCHRVLRYRNRFTCHCSFRNFHIHCSDQLNVSRYLITCREDYEVAHDQLVFGNLDHHSVAAYLHRFEVLVVFHRIELLFRAVLLPEAYTCGQKDGEDDANRLGEITLLDADSEGNCCRNKQYYDDRILKFLQIKFPPWGVGRWGQKVWTMFLSALQYFLI